MVLSCFPKVGEFFMKMMDTLYSSLSNRPRNIGNPDVTLLGICNHVNFIGLMCLKKVCPEYSSYLNLEELEDKMTRDFNRLRFSGKTKAVSADFKSHDSN